jgi:ethanolamine utilization protein EutQ (cupin superfamily)
MAKRQDVVVRVTPDQMPYEEQVPGMSVARVVTEAGITEIGGGYLRFTAGAELKDWTLHYDEAIFVHEGELRIVHNGETTAVRPGEGVVIARGTTVTYRGSAGTLASYVLYPANWQELTT